MKKIAILLFVVIPGMVFSQTKPSLSKAEAALRAGKIDEAKTIIDATVGSHEFMVDKKGQPSKNAAKAWYLKGVIYASMDTVPRGGNVKVGMTKGMAVDAFGEPKSKNNTTNASGTSEQWVYAGAFLYFEKDSLKTYQESGDAFKNRNLMNTSYKSLEANPFSIAKEAFDKAKEIDNGKSLFLINDKNGLPMLYSNVNAYFAQSYFSQAINAYSNLRDFKKAFKLTEETLYFIPEDTAVVLNAGIYFGPSAEEYQKSIAFINQYFAKGGKSVDAYGTLFSIYRDRLKDNETALKVVHEAMVKHPTNSDFPKYELDLYVKMNRLPEAKIATEKQVIANPNDKEPKYFLGVINMELKDIEEAKKWYNEAIKQDPKYFEPRIGLAELIFEDAKKIKSQMNQLGISKEDTKKKLDLDKIYVEKLKVSMPYWTECEKLSPDDAKVLDVLLGIYTDLDMQPEIAKIAKRMKALGLLD